MTARAEYDLFARDRTRAAFDSAIRRQQGYNRGWREIERTSRRSSRTTVRGLRDTSAILATATRRATGFAGALAGAFAGAAGFRAIEVLEQINDQAAGLGTTAQNIGRLSFAFEQFGLSAGEAGRALLNVNRRIEEARRGGQQADVFRELGLSAQFLAQLNLEDRVAEIFQALSRLDDTQRSFIGARLFEESFARIAPLAVQGSEGIRALSQEYDRLAGNIDSAATSAKELAGDQTALGAAASGLGANFVRFLDAIGVDEVINDLSRGLGNLNAELTDIRELGLAEAIIRSFERADFTNLLTAPFQDARRASQEIANNTLEVRDNLNAVLSSIQRAPPESVGLIPLVDGAAAAQLRTLNDERIETELEVLRILREQRGEQERRFAGAVSRETLLPGETPTRPDRLQAAITEREEQQANRRLVQLTERLVEIAEQRDQETVSLG